MIGVCYSSKTDQNITSVKDTYKLLPLLKPGNNLCYKEIKSQIYAVVSWVIRLCCNMTGHINIPEEHTACITRDRRYFHTIIPHIQDDQKVSVHLMITIQKVTSNVQSVPRQSPDIY
jgi:hypothetical protein